MNTRTNSNLTNQSIDQVITQAMSSSVDSSVVPTPFACERDPHKGNIKTYNSQGLKL